MLEKFSKYDHWGHELVPYDELENGMITFQYGKNTYTMDPDDIGPVSADNDAGCVFDPRSVLLMDEEDKILCMES